MKLYQIWTQSSNPRQSYCDFTVWPYDLEHFVTCHAELWDIFHQVWPWTTYTCLNYYSAFWCWYVMSRCNFDLWPADLESLCTHQMSHVTWSKSVRNLSEIEQSPAELWIIFAHTISHCNLDLWPLDLELLGHFGCHAFKRCTKFQRNRIIHGWDIDALARIREQFKGWGRTDRAL